MQSLRIDSVRSLVKSHLGPDSAGQVEQVEQDECRRTLRNVVSAQIIPRLAQAHAVADRNGLAVRTPIADDVPDDAEVKAFALQCASVQPPTAAALIAQITASGREVHSLHLNLITPAARYLGDLWESDDLSFTQVTTGLVLMHQVVHGLGYEFQDGPQHAGEAKRVMMANAPGSVHLLGLVIASEFFRTAGWSVVLEVSPSSEELAHAVGNEWFDMIGLSVALESQLETLPQLVAALKAASRNPAVLVVLGGPIFVAHQLQAARLGADAICTDPRAAVSLVPREQSLNG